MNKQAIYNRIFRYAAFATGTAIALAGLVFISSGISQADTTNTTTASTTAPVISSVAVSNTSDGTGATITWTTDQSANSQIAYGLTPMYSSTTTEDTNLVTHHSVMLGGLTPNTTYHFAVMSGNSTGDMASSSDMMFMTPVAPSTTTTSTTTDTTNTSTSTTVSQTDVQNLQNQITTLQQQVATLQQQVQTLMNNQTNNSGNNSGSTTVTTGTGSTTTTTAIGMISPSNSSVSSGSSVDFTGRNFGIEEPVTVMVNGQTVTTAHADGGGNFSTGSLPVSGTGTQTYTFTGMNSGITGTATVTITS